MMSLGQKALAAIVLLVLNLVVLVAGVGFGGIFGLVLALAFFALSVGAAARILSM